MAAVARFEVHVHDMARACDFYAQLFGWSYRREGGYTRVLADGEEIGGFLTRNAEAPRPGTGPRGAIVTFPVAAVDEAYARALATGGAEALPPDDFDGIGRVCYCEDGEGNIFGMIERKTRTD